MQVEPDHLLDFYFPTAQERASPKTRRVVVTRVAMLISGMHASTDISYDCQVYRPREVEPNLPSNAVPLMLRL